MLVEARAESFARLRLERPLEFRKYLVPALANLSDLSWLLPGAADVYMAFPEISPTPDQIARVRDLLPALGDESVDVREGATRSLEAMGPAAVLVALRLDGAPLLPEQRGRLVHLVAQAHNPGYSDPASRAADPLFLADCLENDDRRVRAAAKLALERLAAIPIPFDVDLTGDARSAAADEVRALLSHLSLFAHADGSPASASPAAPTSQPAAARE